MTTNVTLPVPKWVQEFIQTCKTTLRLHPWTIETHLVQCVNRDPDNMAAVWYTPEITHAIIHLRSDMEDTDDWRATIWHELVHIKLAPIDQFVRDNLIANALDGVAARIAREQWRQVIEPTVDHLSWALYEGHDIEHASIEVKTETEGSPSGDDDTGDGAGGTGEAAEEATGAGQSVLPGEPVSSPPQAVVRKGRSSALYLSRVIDRGRSIPNR